MKKMLTLVFALMAGTIFTSMKSIDYDYDDFMDGVATYADYKNAIASENAYNQVFSNNGSKPPKPLVSYTMYQEHGTELYRPLFGQGETFIDFMSTLVEAPASFYADYDKSNYAISMVDIVSGLIVDTSTRNLRTGEKVYGKYVNGVFMPVLLSNCWNFITIVGGYNDYVPAQQLVREEQSTVVDTISTYTVYNHHEYDTTYHHTTSYETDTRYSTVYDNSYVESNGYGYEPYWDYNCGCYNYTQSGYGYGGYAQFSMGFSSCGGCGDYGYQDYGYDDSGYYGGDSYYYGGDTYIDYGDYYEGDYYSDDDYYSDNDVIHHHGIRPKPTPTDTTGEDDSNNNGGATGEGDSNNNGGGLTDGGVIVTGDPEEDSGNSGGKFGAGDLTLASIKKDAGLTAKESSADSQQSNTPAQKGEDKKSAIIGENTETAMIDKTPSGKGSQTTTTASVGENNTGSVKVIKSYSKPAVAGTETANTTTVAGKASVKEVVAGNSATGVATTDVKPTTTYWVGLGKKDVVASPVSTTSDNGTKNNSTGKNNTTSTNTGSQNQNQQQEVTRWEGLGTNPKQNPTTASASTSSSSAPKPGVKNDGEKPMYNNGANAGRGKTVAGKPVTTQNQTGATANQTRGQKQKYYSGSTGSGYTGSKGATPKRSYASSGSKSGSKGATAKPAPKKQKPGTNQPKSRSGS